MGMKVNDALENEKVRIANTVFNGATEESTTVPTWQTSEGADVGDHPESGALDGENYAVESIKGAEVELDATIGKKRKKKKKKKDKRKHKKAKKTTFD